MSRKYIRRHVVGQVMAIIIHNEYYDLPKYIVGILGTWQIICGITVNIEKQHRT